MNQTNPYTPPVSDLSADHVTNALNQYAGFRQRLSAAFVDGIITAIMAGIVGGILGFIIGATTGGTEGAELTGNILGYIIAWLYAALLESSPKQATWGKQMMKIKVSDLNGDRISFGRATGRHFGKFISSTILLIGYWMMLWTERKQTLHDMMAGCLVTKNG